MGMEVSASRIPVEAYWDQIDPRLLAIETEYFKSEPKGGETMGETPAGDSTKVQDIDVKDFQKEPEDVFTGKTTETFFVTTDYGIKS